MDIYEGPVNVVHWLAYGTSERSKTAAFAG